MKYHNDADLSNQTKTLLIARIPPSWWGIEFPKINWKWGLSVEISVERGFKAKREVDRFSLNFIERYASNELYVIHLDQNTKFLGLHPSPSFEDYK